MPTPEAALALVDWRRRVAALYAGVRAEADPAIGHRLWARGRDELFARHPASPLSADDPLRTSGLPVWPYDPAWRFEVEPVAAAPRLPATAGDGEPADPGEPREVDLGDDGLLTMIRVATVALPAPAAGVLDLWWLHQYGGGLFLPVRDATAGTTSFGAGRYLLDTTKSADLGSREGRLILDLNFLYHPSCRYDPAWTCPLAPAGNHLAAAAEVGERLG